MYTHWSVYSTTTAMSPERTFDSLYRSFVKTVKPGKRMTSASSVLIKISPIMSYCLINSVNSGYCTRVLIPQTFRERNLQRFPMLVRSEVALELRRIRFSDCWSFSDLFPQTDLEFAQWLACCVCGGWSSGKYSSINVQGVPCQLNSLLVGSGVLHNCVQFLRHSSTPFMKLIIYLYARPFQFAWALSITNSFSLKKRKFHYNTSRFFAVFSIYSHYVHFLKNKFI